MNGTGATAVNITGAAVNSSAVTTMNTQASHGSEIITIDVLKANDLLRNSGHRYLDVRTVEEFKKGHADFDDALNIPYMFNTPQGRVKNPNFMEQVLPMCSKEDHLVVGFNHVYNMGGGYLAWVENGLPVTPKGEL